MKTTILSALLLLSACSGGGGETVEDADGGVLQPKPGDRDGDGLSDAEEIAGWELRVDISGQAPADDGSHLELRRVDSDPDNPDTDGDGLIDGRERTAQADPRRADTDGDGLDDAEEVEVYATAPNAVDSDGDAREGGAPNSRLFDGAEVALGASPILVDTDADGLTDYQEIIDGGSHPAVADLPQLDLAIVDAPSVSLNAVEATEEREGLETVSASLEGVSSSFSQSDSFTNETTYGFREAASNETTVGFSINPLDWSAGASNTTKVELEATQTFSNSATHSTTRESARNAQRSFESAVSAERSRSVSYENGTIRVALRLRNASAGITVRVSGVTLVVKRFDPASGRMVVVGELSAVNAIDDNVAAGDAIEAVFENRELGVADIKAILADPRSLSFSIGRYSVRRVDRTGAPTADYAALSESLSRQCGLLVIDFGDGRVERHNVATNLRRDANGRPLGMTLGEALDVLGLDGVETRAIEGQQALWAVDASDSMVAPGQAGHRFWGVIAPTFEGDLRDLQIGPGERITFAYLRDDDGDTLLNREEYLLGTDPALPDTDGDGLNDAEDPDPTGVPVIEPELPRVPEAGLLGWWPIEVEDVTDHGPDSRETTLRCGVGPVRDRHGEFGGALDFADHSEATRCYAEAPLQLGEQSSISVWLRRSETQTSRGFVAGQYGRLAVSAEGRTVLGRIGVPYSDEALTVRWASEQDDELDDWRHVVVTLGPAVADTPGLGRFAIYVDGELVDEQIIEANALARRLDDTPCPERFFFGGADRNCRDGRPEFSGALDDLRVYDRALTDVEITALASETPE